MKQVTYILFALTLFPGLSIAQNAEITGRILDVETGEALPGVNVFLDRTLLGAASTNKGLYSINNLPPGSYTIIASMIGYGYQSIQIEITPEQSEYRFDFKLKPSVVNLQELEVVEKRPRGWARNLKRFNRLFIGGNNNASKTKILNPYVLDFTNTNKEFKATASAPLQIENTALGYRITFVLDDFRLDEVSGLLYMHGPFVFKELEPTSDEQLSRWKENRRRTFRGSLNHLLRSMIRNNLLMQGYRIALDERKNAPYSEEEGSLKMIEGRDYVRATKRPYVYKLKFKHFLYVEYVEEVSWLEITGSEALIHTSGYVFTPPLEPGALTVYGALASRRISDLLPRGYSPEN